MKSKVLLKCISMSEQNNGIDGTETAKTKPFVKELLVGTLQFPDSKGDTQRFEEQF